MLDTYMHSVFNSLYSCAFSFHFSCYWVFLVSIFSLSFKLIVFVSHTRASWDNQALVTWHSVACRMTTRHMSHDDQAHVAWRPGACHMTTRHMSHDDQAQCHITTTWQPHDNHMMTFDNDNTMQVVMCSRFDQTVISRFVNLIANVASWSGHAY